MSDALDDLKATLEATVANAIGRLDEQTKHHLAESVKRGTIHAANGDMHLVRTEANTVAMLLWTDGNERGKQARQDLVQAISSALVKGLIVAL